jgi:YidC/Oxa1 family membrane protein insertase
MNPYTLGPVAAVLDAAYAVVAQLALLLEPVFPVAAAGAAIVVITLLVRGALIPVGVSQARAEVGRRRLAPLISQLRQRHAKNPERLQRELLALYADEKISPFAGFLPMLIQLPIVSIVYGLFTQLQVNGHANGLLEQTVFGVPLGTNLVSVFGGGLEVQHVVVFGALLASIAIVATLSRRFLAPLPPLPQPAAPATAPAGPGPGTESLTRILGYLPHLSVLIAAFVPLAATIYLALTTAWSFAERLILRRRMAG